MGGRGRGVPQATKEEVLFCNGEFPVSSHAVRQHVPDDVS